MRRRPPNLTPSMSKPYPIIRLTSLSDHERLFRGLYALGATFCGEHDIEVAWSNWKGCVYSQHKRAIIHAYVTVYDGCKRINGNSHSDFSHTTTLVNSVTHFLSYAQRLKAAPTT